MVLALMVAFTSLLFSIASATYNLQLNRLFCKDLEKLEYELRLPTYDLPRVLHALYPYFLISLTQDRVRHQR